ncbi:MAG TPA: Sec-independent protein translocase subunit TatA [Actinophytocola sp.]|uniref:Sec-independent protein translocase subunit TatA n=1 Tax=Actinophytocola sp. TaxID=1872138 RepID=UPI002DB6BEB0|nr:Sec-independent protein translocase subunit TatA [Actinophytocola sp.]HEU5474833.1 Sec-independent protein translocase subunit TatA [Actinophytocola sp.]
MNLGPWEILIIAVVIVLLFGARKMPAMARSLGQSMRILKAETKGMRNDDDPPETTEEPAVKPQAQLPQAQPQKPIVAPPIEQTQANKNLS